MQSCETVLGVIACRCLPHCLLPAPHHLHTTTIKTHPLHTSQEVCPLLCVLALPASPAPRSPSSSTSEDDVMEQQRLQEAVFSPALLPLTPVPREQL